MKTKTNQRLAMLQMITLGVLCVTASFALGIQTAGDVRTVASLEAGVTIGDGDFNDDGMTTKEDAIVVLEILRGYQDLTPEYLKADPNGDGQITIDDALHILRATQN